MRFLDITTICLLAVGSLAAPKPPPPKYQAFGVDPTCAEEPIKVRKEWRQLTIPERKDYIRAMKCLHETPGIYKDIVPSSLTLFEDFVAEHKLLTPFIHGESQFLPWHRYFTWSFERALIKQCGYKGIHPYWDYTLDAPPAVLKDSPIFDVHHGFGGDGYPLANPFYPGIPPGMPPSNGGGCQKDGPFKDWIIHIAVKNFTEPRDDRCSARSINENVSRDWCTREVETVIKQQPDYVSVYQNMQGAGLRYDRYFGLHLCGHFMVAGPNLGADIYLGPTDPLFYLHHANLDRIWWEWQMADFENRGMQVSGPLRPSPKRFPGANYTGFPEGNITLDWELEMGRLAGPVRTEDVLDIRKVLRYTYSNPRDQYKNGKLVSAYETDSEDEDEDESYGGTAEFRKKVEELQERWEKYKDAAWGPST